MEQKKGWRWSQEAAEVGSRGLPLYRKARNIVKELRKEVMERNNDIQVWDTETLHTTDWLKCVCRADIGNVIAAFISCNRVPSYSKKPFKVILCF